MPSTTDKASALVFTANNKAEDLTVALEDRLTGTTKQQRLIKASAEKEQILAPDRLPSSRENFLALNPLASAQEIGIYELAKADQDNRDALEASERERQQHNRDRTAGEILSDSVVSVLGKGALGVGEVAYGLADLASRVSPTASPAANKNSTGSLDELSEELPFLDGSLSQNFTKARNIINEEFISEPLQFQQEEVRRANAARSEEAAETLDAMGASTTDKIFSGLEEFAGTVGELVSNPTVAVDSALESLPQMIGPGAITSNLVKGSTKQLTKKEINKIATKTGLSYTAVSEGISNGVAVQGEILNASEQDLSESSELYRALRKNGKSHEDARRQLANEASLITTGMAGLFGLISSKISGAGKFEGKLFQFDSKLGKNFISKTTGASTKGALVEGIEETLQGAGGQFATNVAKSQTSNDDQDLSAGVAEGGGTGLVVGSLSGGVLSGAAEAPSAVKQDIVDGGKAAATAIVKASDKTTGMNDKVRAAVATGTTDKLTNKDAEDYSAEDAINAELSTLDKDTAPTPEKLNEIKIHIFKMAEEISKEDATTKETQAKQKRFKAHVDNLRGLNQALQKEKNADTTAFVENLPDKATPEVSKKIDTSLNSFGSSPRTSQEAVDETLKQAETILKSGLANPEQKAKLQDTIKTLKNFDKVTEEIFNGSNDFQGINFYQESIQAALEIADTESANENLTSLTKFQKAHKQKLEEFEAGFEAWNKLQQGIEITEQEIAAIKKVESRPRSNGNGTYKLANGTRAKIIPAIKREVAALDAAIAQSTNLVKAGPSAVKAEFSGPENSSVSEQSVEAEPKTSNASVSEGQNLLNQAQEAKLKIPAAVRNNPDHKKSIKILKDKLLAHTKATPAVAKQSENDEAVKRPLTQEKVNEPAKEASDSGANIGSAKPTTDKVDKATAIAIVKTVRTEENKFNADAAVNHITKLFNDFVGKGRGPASKGLRDGIKDAVAGTIKPDNKQKYYLLGVQIAKDFDLIADQYNLSKSILENSATTKDRVHKDGTTIINKGDTNILSKLFTFTKTKTTNRLQVVKNLFNEIEKDTSIIGDLTEKQSAAMPKLIKFNKVFKDAFFNGVLRLKDTQFAYQDTFQQFINAGATQENLREHLDENLVSTMAMVALNWLATRSGQSITNNKSAINGMLNGRDSKTQIYGAENLLANVGSYQKNVVSDMGADIIRALGIKVNEDAAGQVLSNLENALGNMAVATLLKTDMVTQTTIPTDLLDALRNDNISSPSMADLENITDYSEKPKSPNLLDTFTIDKKTQIWDGQKWNPINKANTSFIRAAHQEDADGNVIASDQVKEYMEALQDSDLVLDKLFGIDSYTKEPSFEAPTNAPTKIQHSFLSVPKKLQKLLEKVQKRPYKLNQNMLDVADWLEDRNMLIIQGVDFDYETTAHKEDRESIKAKNADILRGYKYLQEFRKTAKDRAFYFKTVVWKTMRMGLESNTVNPLTNKYHRYMLGMESHTVQIDPNNRKQSEQFFSAVAQGLGIDVDKNNTSGSLLQLSELFEEDGILQAGVDAIINKNNPQDVVSAVQKGGENTHSLAALVAYAEYIKADGKPFTTTLTKEVDGITNGTAIGLMQLMRTTPIEQIKKMIKRTGIFTDGESSFGNWINKAKNLDSYQNMSNEWVKGLLGFKTNPPFEFKSKVTNSDNALRGLAGIVGQMMDENGITGVGRKLVKNPLMITNYGAGIGKVIAAFTDNRIGNIYTELAKANQKGDKDKIAQIINNINLTLGKGIKPINVAQVQNNPLEWVMDFRIKLHLQNLISLSYGDTLKTAIENEFGDFIAERKQIVNATSLMFEGFKLRYESGYKLLVEKNNGNLPSRLAVEKLNTVLLDSMPMFKAYFSETNEDGILVMKSTNAPADTTNEKFTTDTRLATPVDTVAIQLNGSLQTHKLVKGVKVPLTTKRLTSHASQPGWKDGGVSGPINAIHNLDAATMINMQENFDAINIHDAGVFSLADVIDGGIDLNRQFKLAMETYSIQGEVNKALVRTMELLQKIDQTKGTNYIGQLNNTQGKKLGTFKNPLSVEKFMQIFDSQTVDNDTTRKFFQSMVTGYDQYTNGEGSTFFTDNKEIPEIGKEQETVINEAVDELVEETKSITEDSNSFQKDLFFTDGFGSDLNNIDPNNFNATSEQEVTNKNVEEVYDALGNGDPVIDTPAHDAHLKNVLSSIISKAMEPLTLYTKELGKTTHGLFADGNIYMQNAIPSKLSALSARMSQKETFVHELIHSVSHTAVNGSSLVARQLRKLYKEVKDSGQITVESFMEGNYQVGDTQYEAELKVAQLRYDYIFGEGVETHTRKVENLLTGEIETEVLDNSHHEFLAIGVTNAAFMEALSKVRTKKKTFRDGETLLEKFTNLLENMLTYISETIAGTRGKTADQKLLLLAGQLAGIDTRAKNKIWQQAEKAGDVVGKSFDTLAYMITRPLQLLISSGFVKNSRSKIIRGIGGVAETIPHLGEYPKVINYIRTSMGITKESLISSYINEMKGRSIDNGYLHDLGRLANKIIDQLRKRVSSHVSKMVHDNYRTELTKKDKDALSKVLLKTDIDGLFNKNADGIINYNEADLIKYLTDHNALDTEIRTIVDTLKNTYTNNGKYYAAMGLSLGHDMATGRPIYNWSLKNANVIAELDSTHLTPEGDLVNAEALIDRLATLNAILHTPKHFKDTAAAVIKSEFASDAKENGILFTMSLHRESKRKALEISFKGQKKLFVKGYTKEILNPNKSFTVGTDADSKRLLREGFTKGEALLTDKHDPREGEQLFMYTSNNGAIASFMSGILSYTNKRAKGTNVLDVYSQVSDIDPAVAAYLDRPLIAAGKRLEILDIANGVGKPLKDDEGVLVPVLDGTGNVTDYRYMMDEHKKDSLLDKDNQLDTILGAMESSIVDKENTEIINNKTIAATKAYYDKNKTAEDMGYTKIGPDSTDPKYKEIYHMLPKATRDEIRKVWGGDSMFVKTEEAVLVFGQRKLSITQLSHQDTEGLKGTDYLNAHANNVVNFLLNRKSVKYAEAIWQEGIKMVKDAIVIKSGVVLLGNVASNTILLKTLGVPIKDVFADQARALVFAKEFLKDTTELDILRDEEKLVPTKKGKNLRRIVELETAINRNPVKELFDAGIHQSIIEDVDTSDNPHSYKSKLENLVDSNKVTSTVVNRTPDLIKTGLKNVFMTHDTSIYKFMRDATQLSDFASRFALHEHNKKQGMNPKESIERIIEAFINYDLPTHRYIQYGNDMGVVMFTKFFIRIQKVIFLLAKERPGSLLATMVAQGLTVDVPDVFDSVITPSRVLNKVGNPIDLPIEIVDAPATLGSTLVD